MTLRDYTADDLMDLADCKSGGDVYISGSGMATGVIMPRDYSAGQIMSTNHSRKLAAQLLRAADLYDAIFDEGYDKGQRALQSRIDELLSTLQFVHAQIRSYSGTGTMGWRSMVDQVNKVLNVDEEDDTQPPIGGPGS